MVKEIIFPAESGGAGPTRFVVEDERRGMLWVREYHPRHGKNRKLQPMTPRRWKQLQREADRGLVSTPRLASIDEYKRLLKAKVERSRPVPVNIALSGKRIVPGVDGEPSHFEGWLTVPGAKAAVKVEFSYRPGPKGTLMEYVETSAMEGFAEALVDSVMRADPDYLNKKKW